MEEDRRTGVWRSKRQTRSEVKELKVEDEKWDLSSRSQGGVSVHDNDHGRR